MASIIRHPRGGWRALVNRKGVRESRVFETKSAAISWATSREAEILAAASGQLPRKTLIDAMRRYAREVAPGHKGWRWEQIGLKAFERTVPCASKVIHQITPADIAAWRDERGRFVTAATVSREWSLLSQVFQVAIKEWRWCRESPMRGVRRPAEDNERNRRVHWREVRAICRRLGWRSRAPETLSQEVALAFLVSLRTGMRAGEILGLQPGDIDLERRVCRLLDTKNGDDRDVPISRAGARLLRLVAGRSPPFSVSNGSRDALFRKAVAACGIEDLHFHDARAEALTRLSKKLKPMQLARVSGHRDLNVLLNRYYRETAEEIAAAL